LPQSPASEPAVASAPSEAAEASSSKRAKLSAAVIKNPALNILPDIKEEIAPDFSPPEESVDREVNTENTPPSNAPLNSSKDELLNDIVRKMENMEVFYPVLDNHIMDELDINIEQWLGCSNQEREQWRDYYDSKKALRENGFMRETIHSIINDVFMNALFGSARDFVGNNKIKFTTEGDKPNIVFKTITVAETPDRVVILENKPKSDQKKHLLLTRKVRLDLSNLTLVQSPKTSIQGGATQ
jgi:hypothetical protein